MTDVTLPYRAPLARALATLRRQLVLDAILALAGTLALIPLAGPVPWRVVALGGGTLLLKSAAAAVAKYDRAVRDDRAPALPEHADD